MLGKFLSSALLANIASASLQIVPGASVTAAGTNQHLQAHGAQIVKNNGLYYLIGENKLNGTLFQSINCYSSPDLVQWTFVNELLTRTSSGDLGPNRIVERPKVMFNSATNKWVMWMHIDDPNYDEAKAGWATGSSICGDYTYLGSEQPLGFQSRDMGLFQDTNGNGYLLTEDRVNGLRIDALSSDYLTVTGATFLWPNPAEFEAPALYKSGSTYYMFASHESGWDPNDNVYCTSTSLTGPWSAWNTFAPAGTDTYDSQTSGVTLINDTVMYQGDRWVSTNLLASTYVWLPLTISGTTVTMTNEVNWILSPSSWSGGPTETTPEAEASTNIIANGAKVVSCSGCSGGETIGFLGGPDNGTLTFPSISSSVSTTTTIRIIYTNADATQRYATVTVNGVQHIVAFIPTGSDNTPADATLTVPLKAGTGNTITISEYQGGWAANVDRIMVPVS